MFFKRLLIFTKFKVVQILQPIFFYPGSCIRLNFLIGASHISNRDIKTSAREDVVEHLLIKLFFNPIPKTFDYAFLLLGIDTKSSGK